MSIDTYGWPVWPTSCIVSHPSWCYCIYLIKIFSMISIVLSLEFQCVSNISFFLLSSLSYLYCKLYKAILPFKKIPYDAYDSQIVDVICDSLNKVISLNIFWPYYFNLFYHAKNNKKKNSLLTLALAHSNVRVLVKPIF